MLGVLMASAFFCLFNETLLSVGNNVVMKQWHLSYNAVQWTMTAFLVSMSLSVPMAAFVIRRRSTPWVLATALALIVVGLAIDAVSPVFPMLIVGRVVEGFGAGFITPLLFTSTLSITDPHHRGIVTAVCGIVCGLGPSLAPLYSGVILDVGLNWHWLFAVPLCVCALLLAVSTYTVSDISPHAGSIPDHLSIVESAVGFPLAIAGIDSLAISWVSRWGWAMAIVGVGFCVTWVKRQLLLSSSPVTTDRIDPETGERYVIAPLLNLRALSSVPVWCGLLLVLLIQMANMCLSVVYPMAVQPAFGLNSVQSSLMLMAPLLFSQLCAAASGRLFDRIGPRVSVFSGFTLLILGFLLFALNKSADRVGLWTTVVAAVCAFVGVAFATPGIEATLFALAPSATADVSTAVQTVMQVGGAIGTAVSMAVFQSALDSNPLRVLYVYAFGDVSWILVVLYALCMTIAYFVVASPQPRR
ncbi:MAG: MFS transporter [Bifidobacteriaceae bacterium]|nr:MFS transporter [Bifidobacteriaceae bacterium]